MDDILSTKVISQNSPPLPHVPPKIVFRCSAPRRPADQAGCPPGRNELSRFFPYALQNVAFRTSYKRIGARDSLEMFGVSEHGYTKSRTKDPSN